MTDHDKALEAAREINLLDAIRDRADTPERERNARQKLHNELIWYGTSISDALLAAHAEIERLRAPTEEMVERAAETHFLLDVVVPKNCPMPTWATQPEVIKAVHRRKARAALSALHPAPDGETR